MKFINQIIFSILLLSSCRFLGSNNTADKRAENNNNGLLDNSSKKDLNYSDKSIFNDSLFSFLNIDSLSGKFISDRIVNTFFYKFKGWQPCHFDFFKTKPEYYDFGCYLISKQTKIDNNKFGVIDLRCPPLEGAIGYLYIVTKDLKITDSIEVVSNWISKNEENEFYYMGETNSKFLKDNIEIEKVSYTCSRNTTCYMDRKEIIKAKILSTGKIEILKHSDEKFTRPNTVYAP